MLTILPTKAIYHFKQRTNKQNIYNSEQESIAIIYKKQRVLNSGFSQISQIYIAIVIKTVVNLSIDNIIVCAIGHGYPFSRSATEAKRESFTHTYPFNKSITGMESEPFLSRPVTKIMSDGRPSFLVTTDIL